MSSLVFLEFSKGKIKDFSKQSITVANQLGSSVLGITDSKDYNYLDSLGEFGLDKVYSISNLDIVDSYIDIIKTEGIKTFILSNSNRSKYISSLLSIKLDIPVVPNILSVPSINNKIKMKSSIFSGKADVDISVKSDSCIFIINKNIIDFKSFNKKVELIKFDSIQKKEIEFEIIKKSKIEGDILLGEADIVVSAGRGLKGPQNWKMIEDLAKKLGAATACSKPVSDAGWRPHHEHVGQTGIKVSPNLYFAIGISGAIQHLAGVNSSKTIVVINNDPEAPFFKSADYGIIGDAFEVVPQIIEALK
mgnify:CR=1 FL=1|tara:strand:+ start:14691 stop:15605 length:915 start_codon:yes stop_codon:yes gene_type:complete